MGTTAKERKMRYFLTGLIVFFTLFTGCATTTKPMPNDVLQNLASDSATVTVIHYQGRPLNMTTVKGVAGEGLAAKFSKSEDLPMGTALMIMYDIEDPNKQVFEKIVDKLKAHGISNLVTKDTPYVLKADAPISLDEFKTDYLLEVIPRDFSTGYMPLNWRSYWVAVVAQLKLTRLSDKTVIWEGFDGGNGVLDKKMRIHVTEFEKDNSAGFKKVIDICTTECSTKLASKFFNEVEK